MEFLFDTANLREIEQYGQFFPYTGVTSNPSIVKAEGKIDFYAHFNEIRRIIGKGRTLHIQVLAEKADGILREAGHILDKVDGQVYIKIPTTEEGLKAMQALKAQGVNVTATAIYTKIQGYMAIAAGADFIAPYYNRMGNMDIDSDDTIASLAQMCRRCGDTKIVAASFKNIKQVNAALECGAHTVTVAPSLLHEAFDMAAIPKAVDDFAADWKAVFGDKGLLDV